MGLLSKYKSLRGEQGEDLSEAGSHANRVGMIVETKSSDAWYNELFDSSQVIL